MKLSVTTPESVPIQLNVYGYITMFSSHFAEKILITISYLPPGGKGLPEKEVHLKSKRSLLEEKKSFL